MAREVMQIVDDLKNKSHTITDEEYQHWMDYPNMIPKVQERDPEAKADYEKVEKLIKQYQENDKDNPPDFLDAEIDVVHPDGRPKPPVTENMPGVLDTHSESNDVVVSTQTLRDFGGKIKELAVFVDKTRDSLELVDMKPGLFGAGTKIYEDVQVDLLGQALEFLKKVSETFIHLRADIDELILQYETAEEWNELSTKQLNDIFRESFGDISGFQNSDPGAAAGGGGGDSSGGDSGGATPPA